MDVLRVDAKNQTGREDSRVKETIQNAVAVSFLVFLTMVGVVKAGENSAALMHEPTGCNYEFTAFPERLKAYEQYRWDLLKRSDFRTAYNRMLGANKHEKWLRLSGLGNMSKHVVINQRSLVMTDSCKMHDCGTHNIVVLYDPDSMIAYGMLRNDREITYLGNPSLCHQQALKNLALGNIAR